MYRIATTKWCFSVNLHGQVVSCRSGFSAFTSDASALFNADNLSGQEYFCAPFGVDQKSCQGDFYFEITTPPTLPNVFVKHP
jgi:hypothetical protein